MTQTKSNEIKNSSKTSGVSKQRENLSPKKVCKVPSHCVTSITKGNKPQTEKSTPVAQQTRLPKVRQFHSNCLLPETPLSCKKSNTSISHGKSVSLVELSLNPKPSTMKKWVSKERVDKLATPVVEHDLFTLGEGRERQLAEKVCKALILLAWRRARAQCDAMKKQEKHLNNQVQSLNLQVLILKDLLESEKVRNNVAVKETWHIKTQLEEKKKTIGDLQQSVQSLETEKVKWERTHDELSEEIKSLTQVLNSKKQVIEDLADKCLQFENCVLEYKDKECQILKKLEEKECKLTNQFDSIKMLKQKCSEDQDKINQLTDRNLQLTTLIESKERKVHECISQIEKMYGEISNLKNMNKVQNLTLLDLRMEVAQGKCKINDYENDISNLKQTLVQLDDDKDKHSFGHRFSNFMFNVGEITLKLLPSPHL